MEETVHKSLFFLKEGNRQPKCPKSTSVIASAKFDPRANSKEPSSNDSTLCSVF